MRHQLKFAFDGEHDEKLARVENRVHLPLLNVVFEDEHDLCRLPVQFQHYLDEINEPNCSVLDGLGRPARKQYFLDLCVPRVKPQPELDALLDQILLPIFQHLPDHLPRDMHQAILNKVISHVHVVLIDGDFKR